MTVTAIHMEDGTEINPEQALCEGCGSSMANHSCSGGSGATTSVTYSRSGKGTTRTPAAAKPKCAHCGGVMHFNMGASAINGECLNRQYALDTGEITDPVTQKPGVLTLERMGEIATWGLGLSTPPTYGGMVTAAGGAGTYSALRPKTGRKKKAVAAAAGSRIEDLADEETVAEETPAPKKGKGKGKKSKSGTTAPTNPFTTAEEIALLPVDEVPVNGHAEDTGMDYEANDNDGGEAGVQVPVADEEDARATRAARRAERKAKMAAVGNR